jgi:hypothetical protein
MSPFTANYQASRKHTALSANEKRHFDQQCVIDSHSLACHIVADHTSTKQLGKADANTKTEAERASKLVALQRKLQDLEKLHTDDKQRVEWSNISHHSQRIIRFASMLPTLCS